MGPFSNVGSKPGHFKDISCINLVFDYESVSK